MENDLKKHSLNTGLTLGGILLLISTLIYSIDFKLFLDTYISLFISLIIIACSTYSIFKTKNNNGGTITFGDAFKSYFIVTAIGYLIYWIWMFIIYNIIDPEAAIAIDEQAMLMAKEMGYDSCPMDGFDFDKVARIINLPHDHIITMMVVVGKKKEDARPRSGQLPLDEVFLTDGF